MNKNLTIIFYFIVLLASCAVISSIPNYTVSLQSDVGYCIWVDGVFFDKNRFPVGSNCGGVKSSTLNNVPIPDKAVITWIKQVHYTKYKKQVPHKAEVIIPKPLPTKKYSERYFFVFTINKDQTVSLVIKVRE